MKLYLSRTTSKKYLTQKLFNWHTSQSTQINSSIFQLRKLFKISLGYLRKLMSKTTQVALTFWDGAYTHTHTHTHTHTRTTQTIIWNDLRVLFQPLLLPVAKPCWNLEALSLNLRTGQFLTEWPWEKPLCSDLIFFNYKTVMMACMHVPFRPPWLLWG